MYPFVWTIVLAVLIVAGLGVGSILVIPLAVLLIPYYLLKRRYERKPTKLVLSLYLTTVGVMTGALAYLIAGFYGYGP
jgi:Flp pilus assembly protein TadB